MTLPSNRWGFAPTVFLIALAFAALTGGANAQVTAEQQSAIRASCRSDFMSKCSGVTPGGKDALVCLQKNVASLSPACKIAVSATIPAPAPPAPAKPAEAAPPPTIAAPAAATAAPAPTASPSITAAPPPAAAPSKPAKPKPQKSTQPPVPPKALVAPPPPPPPVQAVPPPPATRTPNAPVVMTAVIGRACLRDLIRHCRDVKVGDGQKIACLMAHGPSLAPLCKAALKITEPVR